MAETPLPSSPAPELSNGTEFETVLNEKVSHVQESVPVKSVVPVNAEDDDFHNKKAVGGESLSSLRNNVEDGQDTQKRDWSETKTPGTPDNTAEDTQQSDFISIALSPSLVQNTRPSSAWSRNAPFHFSKRNRVASADQRALSLKSAEGTIPGIIVNEPAGRPSSRRSERNWGSLRGVRGELARRENVPAVPPLPRIEPFQAITLSIPSSSLGEIEVPPAAPKQGEPNTNGAKKTTPSSSDGSPKLLTPMGADDNLTVVSRKRSIRHASSVFSPRTARQSSASRTISVDEEALSRKVMLMYEKGDEDISEIEIREDSVQGSTIPEEEPTEKGQRKDGDGSSLNSIQKSPSSTTFGRTSRSEQFVPERETTELAGGLEDWNNIRSGDVDRYGFIVPQSDETEASEFSPPQPVQRVSTSLMLASVTPRRKRTIRKSMLSSSSSIRSFAGRAPSMKSAQPSNRPNSSLSSYRNSPSRSGSTIRYATNKLPYNKMRKLIDEAGDMLTTPAPTQNPDAPPREDSAYVQALKVKEWEREEKWRKMAKLTSKSKDGSGMAFEFDVSSSKLVQRTWKGIPDSWRATAWHAFLSASAQKRKGSPSDEELIKKFNDLQDEPSPDDVQIDIDVPRTINSHIMFRRRYRGGQRLLFRVLHSLSLYYPRTGYVQGMATLAATLLAYYDEEHAFIMLVRLWDLRGLDRLYRSGFGGLMEALGNFEKDWLGGGEVAERLTDLGILPTAYGTKWYLTLFNYSIPFAAQLRVWDVFMLLGEPGGPPHPHPANGMHQQEEHQPQYEQPEANPFGKSFDILHAASAALIDGMRDIILESDFENAMKVLTSWVPINDVELFMRVMRAEWKVHCKKTY